MDTSPIILTRRLGGDAAPRPGDLIAALDWEARRRMRQRVTLSDGRAAELALERPALGDTTFLRDGEVLAGEDGAGAEVRVVIRAAAERLLEVVCESPEALARCAYHLGNRHASVEVVVVPGELPRLRTAADPVMKPMLVGLGAVVSVVDAPFSPEVGAYAHTHDHAGRHDHGPARIHRFVQRG